MNKKIISFILLISFILSITAFQVPASAAESKFYYSCFDSYEVGATGVTANVNGTGSSLASSWFYTINEATGAANQSYINRTSGITTSEFVQRAENNLALKLTVPSQETRQIQFFVQSKMSSSAFSDYIHIAYDIMLDNKYNMSIHFNNAGTITDYSFATFKSDGTFTYKGQNLGNYETGKWYSFDSYYEVSTGKWILYLNGKLERVFTSTLSGLTELRELRFNLGGSGTAATTYLDNMLIGTVSEDDVSANVNALFADNITFTNNSGTITEVVDSVASPDLRYNEFTSDGYTKYEYQGGLFGKSSNDNAVHVYNDAGYYDSAENKLVTYGGINAASLTAGAKVHFSMSLAIDDRTSSNVWVQAIMQNDRPLIFDTNPDGTYLQSLGTQLAGAIAKNAWNKLDFIITIGEDGVSNNTLDVYINGVKANETTLEFSDGGDKVAAGSLSLRVGCYHSVDNTASPDDADYVEGYTKVKSDSFSLDDISSAIYPEAKDVISPEVTFTNGDVTVKRGQIENIGSLSVEEFISGSSSNALFYITNADGTVVTDTSSPAKGKYLVLVPEFGGNIYMPIYDISLPADYAEPAVVIAFPADGDSFIYGVDDTVTIVAEATVYSDVESISFYIDDELVATDTEAPYEYIWTVPDSAGDYDIKASVVDSYAVTATSNIISVNVIANDPPSVSFSVTEAENTIYFGDDFNFTITSSDTDGTISETKFYINNELYDTFSGPSKDYSINFSKNGRYILKAVTYDNLDYEDMDECIVNVVTSTGAEIADITFEDYAVGKTFSITETISNLALTGNAATFAGDMGSKQILEENGNKYLSIGISSTSTGGSLQPYIAAEYFVANAVIEYETDILFDRNDLNHNANFRGEDKNGGAIHMWALTFTNAGEVKVYNGGANTAIGSYSADTWYRLKIKLDIPHKKYDIILTNKSDPSDSCEAIGFNFTDPNCYKLQHIRIVGNFAADKPGFIAYDNMSMRYRAEFPTVTGFTDELGTSNGVSASAQSLACNLTQPMGDVTPQDIILENEYGKVTVESVSVNGETLTVTPKDGFVSSSQYKLTILPTARLADGTEIGFETIAQTETAPKPLDVKGGTFKQSSSGITFTADLVNTTGSEKTVTIVTALYRGTILVNLYSTTVSLTSDGRIPAQPIPASALFDSVKAFVIGDWSAGIPLSAKVFSFN